MILLVMIIGLFGLFAGRAAFRQWFNHVSLYSGIWGLSLMLYDLHLINYYKMETETWIIILGGWILFIIGSLTVVFARNAIGADEERRGPSTGINQVVALDDERRILEIALWILIFISLVAALHTWYVLIQMFGSVTDVLLRGAFLYKIRVSEGIKGSIPYFKFLCLPATLLAGVYTAKIGKLKIVAILPIVISIIVDLSSMGRAMMIMAAILFTTGYFLTKKENENADNSTKIISLKKLSMFVMALVLLFAGSELVRSTRHVNENVVGAKRTLQRLEGASFITPSIYLYITGHHAVLNQYLKDESVEKFPAANTFAPFFRLLAKFGFDTEVESYQKFFRIPVTANTGTYLRELHSDFGITGILFGPYVIGILCSYFWFRYRRSKSYVSLVILSYMQVMVAMSLFYLVTIAGYLLVYLIIGLCIAVFIDYRLNKIRHAKTNYHPA
jgi:oligosaccharide repeat unit polymerase